MAVSGAAPAERVSDVQPQRPFGLVIGQRQELALVPQLAAQVDVPFDLSHFFTNLEAKRRDDREKERERRRDRGGLPEGRSLSRRRWKCYGFGLRPRDHGAGHCGSSTNEVQAWEYGSMGESVPFLMNVSSVSFAVSGCGRALAFKVRDSHFSHLQDVACHHVPRTAEKKNTTRSSTISCVFFVLAEEKGSLRQFYEQLDCKILQRKKTTEVLGTVQSLAVW